MKQSLTYYTIRSSTTSFLTKIFEQLKNNQIAVDTYVLDHICYRVDKKEDYDEYKELFTNHGQLLTETIINGRPIATFKVKQPIQYKGREIELIELPAPKTGSIYKEGFEHVEFVIDCDLATFKKRNPHIEFDEKEMSKEINPSLRIQFADISVKFHEHSLEYVIKYLD